MHIEKILSDEPLYDVLSDLDAFHQKNSTSGFNLKRTVFIGIASSFCGFATYSTINGEQKFDLNRWESVGISTGVVLILGLIATLSHHARCSVSLMLPVLFSGTGRTLIRALIISLIVSGPLQNVIDNSLLFAKSLECSAKLTVKQANETAQATVTILEQQMESISQATRAINENTRAIEMFADHEMARVLDEEDESGHLSPNEMMKRGAKQCHRNTDGPRMKCEVGINSDLEKCNKMRVTNDGCQEYESNSLQSENIQMTQDVKDSISKFGEQYNDPNLKLTSENKIDLNSYKVTEEFKKTSKAVGAAGHVVSSFMNYLSVILLCLVLVKSIKHQIYYLTKLSYLNNVVTTQLLHLDARLPAMHRTFPLPVYMRHFVRDGKQKCLSGEEIKLVLLATLKHGLFSMIFLFIYFLDVSVYGILEDIADSGYIVYEVYLKIGVILETSGGKWTKGIMDKIPQMNDIHHLSFTQDNNNCLPDATPPDTDNTICILVYIGLIILLNFFEIYSRRTVRLICAWFYPNREHERVQFIYRFLKQRRIDCFNMLVENRRGCLPPRSGLSKVFPKIFKTKCVICGEKDIQYTCFYCFGHGYDITYCTECWTDIYKKCTYCRSTQKLSEFTANRIFLESSDSETDDEAITGHLILKSTSNIYISTDESEDEIYISPLLPQPSRFKEIPDIFVDSASSDEESDLLGGVIDRNNLTI